MDGFGGTGNEADAPYLTRLLRARRARPSHGAAEQHYELAPLHSITSSARASSNGGNSIPSALAVLRLRISSYLVGCSTGRSAALAPFKILPTYVAARRMAAT